MSTFFFGHVCTVACVRLWTPLTSGYVLFPCRKNGCLPDYIPDSSARQRKVESPSDEEKFTYIAVMMKINLPTLLCCCTWNREWGKGLLTSPVFGAIFLEF
jgi:hypothetical protein